MVECVFLSLLWIPSATLPTRTVIATQPQHKTRSTFSTNYPSTSGPSLLFLKLSFSRCSPHYVSEINIFVLLKHTSFHLSCASAPSLQCSTFLIYFIPPILSSPNFHAMPYIFFMLQRETNSVHERIT